MKIGSNEVLCSFEKTMEDKDKRIDILESQLEIFGNHNKQLENQLKGVKCTSHGCKEVISEHKNMSWKIKSLEQMIES